MSQITGNCQITFTECHGQIRFFREGTSQPRFLSDRGASKIFPGLSFVVQNIPAGFCRISIPAIQSSTIDIALGRFAF